MEQQRLVGQIKKPAEQMQALSQRNNGSGICRGKLAHLLQIGFVLHPVR